MSIKCKYITYDKLEINKITFLNYQCEDMSVMKSSEKKYKENKKCKKEDNNFGYVNIKYYNNLLLYLTTPKMKCLFGINKSSSNSFQMNLQFTNLNDQKMKSFFNFIKNIELLCMKHLEIDESDNLFVSQIKYDKNNKYEPNLSVKVPFSYNKFNTELYSDYSDTVNILNINNFQDMECDIYIDKIWKLNNKYYMKWKVKIIHLL